MDSKKILKWTLTDCWELGYDFTCPSCGYTFFTKYKDAPKPEECPRCKREMDGQLYNK